MAESKLAYDKKILTITPASSISFVYTSAYEKDGVVVVNCETNPYTLSGWDVVKIASINTTFHDNAKYQFPTVSLNGEYGYPGIRCEVMSSGDINLRNWSANNFSGATVISFSIIR